MTAFAVAIPLSLFYPTLGIGLLFCALSIATSRILLGMHFLSDVVAGALIGATGLPGLFRLRETGRSNEWERGTQECVRHGCSNAAW